MPKAFFKSLLWAMGLHGGVLGILLFILALFGLIRFFPLTVIEFLRFLWLIRPSRSHCLKVRPPKRFFPEGRGRQRKPLTSLSLKARPSPKVRPRPRKKSQTFRLKRREKKERLPAHFLCRSSTRDLLRKAGDREDKTISPEPPRDRHFLYLHPRGPLWHPVWPVRDTI